MSSHQRKPPQPNELATGGPTIVGGQPPKHTPNKVKISAGVEQALYLAATDEAFGQRLLEHRERAAQEAGLSLQPSEAAVLRAAPRHQLQALVASLDTSPGNLQRRGFLQAVAASAVAFAAGGALGGCSEDDKDVDSGGQPQDGGIEMDAPESRDAIAPDLPPDIVIDAPESRDAISPDVPPLPKQDKGIDIVSELSVDGIKPDMPKLDLPIPGPDSAGIKPDL